MNILENLFQQYKYLAELILKRRFKVDLANNLISFLDNEYHNLINSDDIKRKIPKIINQKMHLVTPCFVNALYRALKIRISPSFPIDKLGEIMMDIFRELVGSLAEMQRNQINNASNK